MKSNISYLPGAREEQLATKMVRFWELIRADISRYLTYKKKNITDDEKIYLKMKKSKNRILNRLWKIVSLQSESGKTNEEWEDILIRALKKSSKVDTDKEEYKQSVEDLLGGFRNDTTTTKVLFAQKFMQIIAHVSSENISIPFNPS